MPKSLKRQSILLLDCQTTGASPDRGHLLELGWCPWRAGEPEPHPRQIEARLLRLPGGDAIPPHISRLTGITRQEHRAQAVARKGVWSELSRGITASKIELSVAHYARFEEQFLRHFHGQQTKNRRTDFPLRFVCTHEIAKRLYPNLPRRGIRALAGFFGFSLPETKRVTPNVLATAKIWRQLVQVLEEDHGIGSLDELSAFLEMPVPSRKARFEFPLAREKRLGLPEDPGVYRFLGSERKVLYVGKATSLRTRVNSYYRKRRGADKILELVSQARDVDVSVTPTALEAALLEVEQIRTHDPPYNKALRNLERSVWY